MIVNKLARRASTGLCVFVSSIVLATPLSKAEREALKERNGNAPSEQALRLAAKICSERDLDGLRTVVELHDRALLLRCRGNWRTPDEVLPDQLEALIVEHYRVASVGNILRRLIGESPGQPGDSQWFPKYRTRALFELMYQDLASNPQSLGIARALASTDLPGIEPALLELLPRVSPGEAAFIVSLLQRRKFAPAIPLLRKLQESTPPSQNVNQFLERISATFISIGTPEAMDALMHRLAWLMDQPANVRRNEVFGMLYSLTERLPADAPFDYARFRKLLGSSLSDPSDKLQHVKLIQARKEKLGIPDLINYLPMRGDAVVGALLEVGSPDDWRKARAELERFQSEGKIDAVHFSDVKRRLDAAILDPGIVTAATRDRAFQREKGALSSVLIEANKARDSDSARYVAMFQEYLAGLERLRSQYTGSPSSGGMHDEIRNGYMDLAGYVRFVQKQPERAAGLYQKAAAMGAARAGEKSILDVGGIDMLLGDVYQFDLRNSVAALEHYELALDRVNKTQTEGSDIEKAFFGRQKIWLQHEIAYLKTGRTFAGTVERDDALGFIGLAFFASDPAFGGQDTRALYKDPAWRTDRSKVDREKLREKMEQLPSSRVTLLKTIVPLSLLPTEASILRYLKKHDPSGYLSACILGAVPYIDQVLKDQGDKDTADQMRAILPGVFVDAPQRGNAFRLASARFLKENRITVHVAAADPRKSTPENTWKLFIESLRDGNLETAFSCLTGGMAAKLRPAFSQMPRQALRDIASSFSGFSVTTDMGNSREAAVMRGDRLGLIYFVLELGEWKIQEM